MGGLLGKVRSHFSPGCFAILSETGYSVRGKGKKKVGSVRARIADDVMVCVDGG